MKKIILIFCFSNMLVFLLVNCDSSKKAFQQAEDIATKESYEQFIRNNPTSKYINNAENRIKDIIFWEQINTSKSINLYDNYLEIFPNGLFCSKAKQKIKMISDLDNAQSKEAIEKFIKDYPNSELLNLADYKMKDIELWEQVKSKQSIDLYKNYIASFPDGIFVTQAKQTILLLSKKAQLSLLTDNSFSILSASFSPDGRYIIAGGSDHIIKLWDVLSGILIRSFEGHSNTVNSIHFNLNGTRFITGSADHTIKIWDLKTGNIIRSFDMKSSVFFANFSSDESYIISASYKSINLWSMKTGKVLHSFVENLDSYMSVSLSPDGKYIASGGRDKKIILWNTTTKEKIRFFIGHEESVQSIDFSPDCKYLVSGSKDNTVKLWETESGKLEKNFIGHTDEVNVVKFSPKGKYIISGSSDKSIKLWDIKTGNQIKSFDKNSKDVLSVNFSPDAKSIVSGTSNNKVLYWSIETGKIIKTFPKLNHAYPVQFSPDETHLISGCSDNTLKLWDIESGKLSKTFVGHTDHVISVNFSPDGSYIVSGSCDKTAKLWESESGKLIKTFDGHSDFVSLVFDGHTDCVSSVTFSPNGKKVLSGSFDKKIKLWSVKTGNLLKELNGHKEGVYLTKFSPDGKFIASKSYGSVKIWNLDSGECIKTFEKDGYDFFVSESYLNFSPDSRFIIVAKQYKGIKIWDIHSNKLVWLFEKSGLPTPIEKKGESYYLAKGNLYKIFESHLDNIITVSFSPDGNSFISGSSNGTIATWNVYPKSEQEVKFFLGHTNSFRCIRFIHRGSSLQSYHGSRAIDFLSNDPKTDQEINLPIKTLFLNCINFSPSAKYSVSSSFSDKSIRLRDLKNGKEVMVISFLPNNEWLIWSSNQLNYNSSENGDKYAAIKLKNETWNYQLLTNFRKQYRGKFKSEINQSLILESAAKVYKALAKETDTKSIQNFIKKYRNTIYAKQAKERLDQLSLKRFNLLSEEDNIEILRIYLKEYKATKGEALMKNRLDKMGVKYNSSIFLPIHMNIN